MNYFASQVGKMVPVHEHDWRPTLIMRDASVRLNKAAPTVEVCRVCGVTKEAR